MYFVHCTACQLHILRWSFIEANFGSAWLGVDPPHRAVVFVRGVEHVVTTSILLLPFFRAVSLTESVMQAIRQSGSEGDIPNTIIIRHIDKYYCTLRRCRQRKTIGTLRTSPSTPSLTWITFMRSHTPFSITSKALHSTEKPWAAEEGTIVVRSNLLRDIINRNYQLLSIRAVGLEAWDMSWMRTEGSWNAPSPTGITHPSYQQEAASMLQGQCLPWNITPRTSKYVYAVWRADRHPWKRESNARSTSDDIERKGFCDTEWASTS